MSSITPYMSVQKVADDQYKVTFNKPSTSGKVETVTLSKEPFTLTQAVKASQDLASRKEVPFLITQGDKTSLKAQAILLAQPKTTTGNKEIPTAPAEDAIATQEEEGYDFCDT